MLNATPPNPAAGSALVGVTDRPAGFADALAQHSPGLLRPGRSLSEQPFAARLAPPLPPGELVISGRTPDLAKTAPGPGGTNNLGAPDFIPLPPSSACDTPSVPATGPLPPGTVAVPPIGPDSPDITMQATAVTRPAVVRPIFARSDCLDAPAVDDPVIIAPLDATTLPFAPAAVVPPPAVPQPAVSTPAAFLPNARLPATPIPADLVPSDPTPVADGPVGSGKSDPAGSDRLSQDRSVRPSSAASVQTRPLSHAVTLFDAVAHFDAVAFADEMPVPVRPFGPGRMPNADHAPASAFSVTSAVALARPIPPPATPARAEPPPQPASSPDASAPTNRPSAPDRPDIVITAAAGPAAALPLAPPGPDAATIAGQLAAPIAVALAAGSTHAGPGRELTDGSARVSSGAAVSVGDTLTPVAADRAGSAVVVRLNPGELGRVQVRIGRAAGAAREIDLTVERPETLLLLLRDQPALHRALDLAGIAAEARVVRFHLADPAQGALFGAPAPGAAPSDAGQSSAGQSSGQAFSQSSSQTFGQSFGHSHQPYQPGRPHADRPEVPGAGTAASQPVPNRFGQRAHQARIDITA